MAKISELSNEQLEKQLKIIKKAITGGDDSKKKIFAALMKEYKSRKAATQKAPAAEEPEEVAEEKPAKKGKKKGGKISSRNKRVSGRSKAVSKGKSGRNKVAPKGKSGRNKEAKEDKKGRSRSKASAGGDKTAIGKVRKPIMVIVYTIITLGIYSLVHSFKVFNELKNYRGQGMSGAVVLLLSFTPVGIIFPWLLPSYIGKLYEEDGQEAPVKGMTGCWMLLFFIGGGFVWTFKVQGALNTFWQEKMGPEDDNEEEEEDDEEMEDEDEEEEED